MTSKTRANYEKAKGLRDSGLSLSQIGERLGVSKQYVAKILKGQPSTKASTASVNQLTPRQRSFAKGLAEGKTQKQASIEAVPTGSAADNSLEQWASRTVRDPKFQQTFKQIRAENGLADEDIARVHRGNLSATKVVATASQDGKITDVLERPDYAVRQRAVADALRINGRMKADASTEPPPQPRIVVLSQADAEAFKVFTGGGPLPPSIQVAPEGIAREFIEAEGETVDVRGDEVLPDEAGG